nr:MmgE/PrpD family protein [Pelomonas sp. P8]
MTDFVCAWQQAQPHEMVLHQAKRLLLNQLKASAEASRQPAGLQLLAQAALAAGVAGPGTGVALWWSGLRVPRARAALLHGQLLEQLDYGDTHLPSQTSITAALLPDLLALGEIGRHGGARVLTALLVGVEVALAARDLTPAPHVASVARDLGAAASRCTLLGLTRAATSAALAPMCAAWPQAAGDAPQAGAALADLDDFRRVHEIALHCRPLPVAALAPVEAALALRAQAGGRSLQRLRLAVWPGSSKAPQRDELLLDSVATAWLMGQFTADERLAACREHPTTRRLRDTIHLWRDDRLPGVHASRLEAWFDDGGQEAVEIDFFLGSPAHPLCDSQLCELFRSAADDVVLPRRSGEILQALWGLDRSADVGGLLALLRRPA